MSDVKGKYPMNVIYNEFKSIADIKRRGEFLRAGKIIPSRIVKCSNRKMQHCVKTGSNQWAFPTKSGYLIFVENNDVDFKSVIRMLKATHCSFYGSPYSPGGSYWEGNNCLSESDLVVNFNKLYKSKNEVRVCVLGFPSHIKKPTLKA
jgi:hypothetical protein